MSIPADPLQGGNADSLPQSETAAVPVFNCVAYVSKKDGRYIARNGHWDVQCEAGSERVALQRLASEFKQRAAAAHQAGEELPFDDPPLPMRDDETERLIPVHL